MLFNLALSGANLEIYDEILFTKWLDLLASTKYRSKDIFKNTEEHYYGYDMRYRDTKEKHWENLFRNPFVYC